MDQAPSRRRGRWLLARRRTALRQRASETAQRRLLRRALAGIPRTRGVASGHPRSAGLGALAHNALHARKARVISRRRSRRSRSRQKGRRFLIRRSQSSRHHDRSACPAEASVSPDGAITAGNAPGLNDGRRRWCSRTRPGPRSAGLSRPRGSPMALRRSPGMRSWARQSSSRRCSAPDGRLNRPGGDHRGVRGNRHRRARELGLSDDRQCRRRRCRARPSDRRDWRGC